MLLHYSIYGGIFLKRKNNCDNYQARESRRVAGQDQKLLISTLTWIMQ